MLKSIKINWKRVVSGLLAVVMAAGMLPVFSYAADTGGDYPLTGNFELNVAGTTAWNGGGEALTVYKTESGSTQATAIPAGTPFALLEDKGSDRLKIGYQDGGWTGADLDVIGWVDKDSILVNLPDILPSIAYASDSGRLFSSRLTRFEYVVPGSYALAEQLAQLQQAAMACGDTLVVRKTGQTVSVSRAKVTPPSFTATAWTERPIRNMMPGQSTRQRTTAWAISVTTCPIPSTGLTAPTPV